MLFTLRAIIKPKRKKRKKESPFFWGFMGECKVFDKKNTTQRVDIIFAKPEGPDLASTQ
jgi:hypothetical protein